MPIANLGTPVTNAFHTGANSFNVNAPGSLTAADVVVIMIRHTYPAPAFACTGFTNVFTNYISGGSQAGVCALVGSGFTGTPTFNVTSSLLASDGVAEACFAYSGASPSALASAGTTGSVGGNVTVPGVTFAGAGGRAIIMWQQPFVASPRTVTPAMTTVAAWNTSCYAADLNFASAGATGSFVVNNSSFTEHASVIIGLEEASSFIPEPHRSFRSTVLRR